MSDTYMTENSFEDNLALYGTDITTWPTAVQASAKLFARSARGKALMADYEMLDTEMQTFSDTANDFTLSANMLHRLKSIPTAYSAPAVETAGIGSVIKQMLDDLADNFSPKVWMTQAASMALALFMGFYISLDQGTDITSDDLEADVDISASLFAELDEDAFTTEGEEDG